MQPDIAVFVKYEFWLHYMQQGLKYGSHMVAAGCLFREEQFIFEPPQLTSMNMPQQFYAVSGRYNVSFSFWGNYSQNQLYSVYVWSGKIGSIFMSN